jgi:hypothetical protein
MLEKIEKEFFEKAIVDSNSFSEVCIKLGFDPKKGNIKSNVERKIKRLGLITSHFETVKMKQNRWDKEKIGKLIKTCTTYKDILLELDYLPIETNYRKLKKLLNEWGLEFTPTKAIKNKWRKDIISDVVNSSFSYRECLRKLNINSIGGNHYTLKKYIELYNLNTTHFNIEKCFKPKKDITEYLIVNSKCSRTNLKRRLLEEGYLENKCCLCGQDKNWNGFKISLILDHTNGIPNDNRLENLRIVCPNCNAGLDTFTGKNKNRLFY